MQAFDLKSAQHWEKFFFVLVGVITLLAFMPKEPELTWDEPWYLRYLDKWEHLLAFISLGVSGLLAYRGKPHWVVLGLGVYGALIEMLQPILTGTRFADPVDFVADISGILLAWILIRSKRGLRKFIPIPEL
jgi:hypothetical protein